VSILYFAQFNPFCYSSISLPSNPHYLTDFNIYHYILYLDKCNVFQYHWLSYHSLFLSLLSWIPYSNSTITNMFSICLYMIVFCFV
jgi:hypothetical protein